MRTGSRNSGIDQKKLIIISSLMLAVFGLYIVRLFSLQIVDNYIYKAQADEVSRRRQIIPTRRGEVYDRNFDQPLVTNIDTFAILLDLSEVPGDGLQELIGRLANALNTDETLLWSKIPSSRNDNFTRYEIWSGASFHQISGIAERIDQYPGISWESRPTRYYTQRDLMAHVLGFTGEITSEELQILYNQGYAGAREIGKTGVEKQYDDLLRGEEGIRYGRVDARGRQVQDLEDVPPELGNSLVLTLDRHIQRLVEDAIGPRIGGAVVMNPANGEILAMHSYPDYDPNIFYSAGADSDIQRLNSDPRAPLINRTIQAAGSPASTFKTLMSVAMLQEQAFDPQEEIYCPGYVVVGDRTFHCHDLDGHGYVNMYEALAESCNVYYYTIGKDHLEVEGILDYSLRFGLGDYSGIDLPNEVRGLLPTPEWKELNFNSPWVGGDTVNLSIGQGYLTVTPLQMANLTAAIVNDGLVYQPHVLKEVRDQSSLELIDTFEPRILRDIGVDPGVFQEVRKGMEMVVTDGTARWVITSDSTQIAGKTGTAQTGFEEKKHSWFISYAPADAEESEQQYVVVVWIDAANEWDWWGPKAANIIIHGIMNNMNFEDTVRDLQPLWYLGIPELEQILNPRQTTETAPLADINSESGSTGQSAVDDAPSSSEESTEENTQDNTG